MYQLTSELEHIKNECRILQSQWKSTSQVWNDSIKQQFEKEFWNEIEKLIPAYIRKLEETENLILKAYRELEI